MHSKVRDTLYIRHVGSIYFVLDLYSEVFLISDGAESDEILTRISRSHLHFYQVTIEKLPSRECLS